ncbi:MAG: hypothetical protein RhofKO_26290 [Rhodothermales bacterium]
MPLEPMPDISSLLPLAKVLGTTLTSIGLTEARDFISEQRRTKRAVAKAAEQCAGFAPGGKQRVKERLTEWAESLDFETFVFSLLTGHDIETALETGLSSFVDRTGFTNRSHAEQILERLLEALRDEAYNAKNGLVVAMRRVERLHADVQLRDQNLRDSLEPIREDLASLSTPVRSAVQAYLDKSGSWQPVDSLIKDGTLAKAAEDLDRRTAQLDLIIQEHSESAIILRDHLQDLFLKRALIFSQEGDAVQAYAFYQNAKGLVFTNPERRQQALTVLLNIHAVQEYETLLDTGEVSDRDKAEIELLLLKEDWTAILNRIPHDTKDFRQLYLLAIAELRSDSLDATRASDWLNEATLKSRNHALHWAQLALASIDLVARLVEEQLTSTNLDRTALLRATQERISCALKLYGSTATPIVGHHELLSRASYFFSLTQDRQRLISIQDDIENLRSLHTIPEDEQNTTSTSRTLILHAERQLTEAENRQPAQAIPILQAALDSATSDEPELRLAAAERLISLLLEQGAQAEAEQILNEATEHGSHEWAILAIPLIYHQSGLNATIVHLSDAVDAYPSSLHLRRTLVEQLIISLSKEIDGSNHDLGGPLDSIAEHVSTLQSILPCTAHILLLAEAYERAEQHYVALELLKSLGEGDNAPIAALERRARILILLERFCEVAELFSQLAERTGLQSHATNAAAYWLNDHEPEKAVAFLEPWVERYPDDPYLTGNLGIALIIGHPDAGIGQRALDLLTRTLQTLPEFNSIRLWIHRAADLAGDEVLARQSFQEHFQRYTPISIARKEDFDALNELENDFGVFSFQGKAGHVAFIEREKERSNAFLKMLHQDLLSYADLFDLAGQAWANWTQWTNAAFRLSRDSQTVRAVKAPWPYPKIALDPQKGVLLDLTALLTLSVLSDSDKLLYALLESGRKPHILSSDLALLRESVAAPIEHAINAIEHDYEGIVALLDKNNLLSSFTDEDIAQYEQSVPNELEAELGNSGYDFGLALQYDNSLFVADHYTPSRQQVEAEHRIITSGTLLHLLVKEGIIGASTANNAAETTECFKGWSDTEVISLPDQIVISGFALVDWYEANLLTDEHHWWLREDMPDLLLGPFGQGHLLKQERENREKRLKSDTVKSFYGVLRQFVRDHSVVVIHSDIRTSSYNFETRLLELWPKSLELLRLASQRNLNIWTDDRVIGYLIWPFGHPIAIPEISQEISLIREFYSDIAFTTSEELLDVLGNSQFLEPSEAEELGFELVRMGYRPLRFRLALRYLLRNFSYTPRAAKYQYLIHSIQDTLAQLAPSSESSLSFPILDTKRLVRLFLINAIPDLIYDVWFIESPRTIDERRELATAILEVAFPEIDRHEIDLPTAGALFWAGVYIKLAGFPLTRLGQSSTESSQDSATDKDELIDQAISWITTFINKDDKANRQENAIRYIEDYVIEHVKFMPDRWLDYRVGYDEDFDSSISTDVLIEIGVTFSVRNCEVILGGLYKTPLIEHVNPIFRRTLGVLGRYSSSGFVTKHALVESTELLVEYSENEAERAALMSAAEIIEESGSETIIRQNLVLPLKWVHQTSDELREQHPSLPAQYVLYPKIPLVVLLLRDDIHSYPHVIDLIIKRLHLLDPTLGAKVLALQGALTSPDQQVRKTAHNQLGAHLVESPYFEIQRSLTHGAHKLRQMNNTRLEQYLLPDSGWLPSNLHNHLVTDVDGVELPIGAVQDSVVLTSADETLFQRAQNEVLGLEGLNATPAQIYSSMALTLREDSSPWQMAYTLLIALVYLDNRLSATAPSVGEEEKAARSWVNDLLIEVLSYAYADRDSGLTSARLRSPSLKIAHSCLLRISTWIVFSPDHIAILSSKIEEEHKQVARGISLVLVLCQRLMPMAIGHYGRGSELARECTAAMHTLGLTYEAPGHFPDHFNPYLLGDHLLDHEVAAVLHVLKVFLQHGANPESVVDYKALLPIIQQWKKPINDEVEKLHHQQKSEFRNSLHIKIPFSPVEASHELIEQLEGRSTTA